MLGVRVARRRADRGGRSRSRPPLATARVAAVPGDEVLPVRCNAIDERPHEPSHESDHVINLTYNILTGGTCLEDIERRAGRQLPGGGQAPAHPDPATAGDLAWLHSNSRGFLGISPCNLALQCRFSPWPASGLCS